MGSIEDVDVDVAVAVALAEAGTWNLEPGL